MMGRPPSLIVPLFVLLASLVLADNGEVILRDYNITKATLKDWSDYVSLSYPALDTETVDKAHILTFHATDFAFEGRILVFGRPECDAPSGATAKFEFEYDIAKYPLEQCKHCRKEETIVPIWRTVTPTHFVTLRITLPKCAYVEMDELEYITVQGYPLALSYTGDLFDAMRNNVFNRVMNNGFKGKYVYIAYTSKEGPFRGLLVRSNALNESEAAKCRGYALSFAVQYFSAGTAMHLHFESEGRNKEVTKVTYGTSRNMWAYRMIGPANPACFTVKLLQPEVEEDLKRSTAISISGLVESPDNVLLDESLDSYTFMQLTVQSTDVPFGGYRLTQFDRCPRTYNIRSTSVEKEDDGNKTHVLNEKAMSYELDGISRLCFKLKMLSGEPDTVTAPAYENVTIAMTNIIFQKYQKTDQNTIYWSDLFLEKIDASGCKSDIRIIHGNGKIIHIPYSELEESMTTKWSEDDSLVIANGEGCLKATLVTRYRRNLREISAFHYNVISYAENVFIELNLDPKSLPGNPNSLCAASISVRSSTDPSCATNDEKPIFYEGTVSTANIVTPSSHQKCPLTVHIPNECSQIVLKPLPQAISLPYYGPQTEKLNLTEYHLQEITTTGGGEFGKIVATSCNNTKLIVNVGGTETEVIGQSKVIENPEEHEKFLIGIEGDPSCSEVGLHRKEPKSVVYTVTEYSPDKAIEMKSADQGVMNHITISVAGGFKFDKAIITRKCEKTDHIAIVAENTTISMSMKVESGQSEEITKDISTLQSFSLYTPRICVSENTIKFAAPPKKVVEVDSLAATFTLPEGGVDPKKSYIYELTSKHLIEWKDIKIRHGTCIQSATVAYTIDNNEEIVHKVEETAFSISEKKFFKMLVKISDPCGTIEFSSAYEASTVVEKPYFETQKVDADFVERYRSDGTPYAKVIIKKGDVAMSTEEKCKDSAMRLSWCVFNSSESGCEKDTNGTTFLYSTAGSHAVVVPPKPIGFQPVVNGIFALYKSEPIFKMPDDCFTVTLHPQVFPLVDISSSPHHIPLTLTMPSSPTATESESIGHQFDHDHLVNGEWKTIVAVKQETPDCKEYSAYAVFTKANETKTYPLSEDILEFGEDTSYGHLSSIFLPNHCFTAKLTSHELTNVRLSLANFSRPLPLSSNNGHHFVRYKLPVGFKIENINIDRDGCHPEKLFCYSGKQETMECQNSSNARNEIPINVSDDLYMWWSGVCQKITLNAQADIHLQMSGLFEHKIQSSHFINDTVMQIQLIVESIDIEFGSYEIAKTAESGCENAIMGHGAAENPLEEQLSTGSFKRQELVDGKYRFLLSNRCFDVIIHPKKYDTIINVEKQNSLEHKNITVGLVEKNNFTSLNYRMWNGVFWKELIITRSGECNSLAAVYVNYGTPDGTFVHSFTKQETITVVDIGKSENIEIRYFHETERCFDLKLVTKYIIKKEKFSPYDDHALPKVAVPTIYHIGTTASCFGTFKAKKVEPPPVGCNEESGKIFYKNGTVEADTETQFVGGCPVDIPVPNNCYQLHIMKKEFESDVILQSDPRFSLKQVPAHMAQKFTYEMLYGGGWEKAIVRSLPGKSECASKEIKLNDKRYAYEGGEKTEGLVPGKAVVLELIPECMEVEFIPTTRIDLPNDPTKDSDIPIPTHGAWHTLDMGNGLTYRGLEILEDKESCTSTTFEAKVFFCEIKEEFESSIRECIDDTDGEDSPKLLRFDSRSVAFWLPRQCLMVRLVAHEKKLICDAAGKPPCPPATRPDPQKRTVWTHQKGHVSVWKRFKLDQNFKEVKVQKQSDEQYCKDSVIFFSGNDVATGEIHHFDLKPNDPMHRIELSKVQLIDVLFPNDCFNITFVPTYVEEVGEEATLEYEADLKLKPMDPPTRFTIKTLSRHGKRAWKTVSIERIVNDLCLNDDEMDIMATGVIDTEASTRSHKYSQLTKAVLLSSYYRADKELAVTIPNDCFRVHFSKTVGFLEVKIDNDMYEDIVDRDELTQVTSTAGGSGINPLIIVADPAKRRENKCADNETLEVDGIKHRFGDLKNLRSYEEHVAKTQFKSQKARQLVHMNKCFRVIFVPPAYDRSLPIPAEVNSTDNVDTFEVNLKIAGFNSLMVNTPAGRQISGATIERNPDCDKKTQFMEIDNRMVWYDFDRTTDRQYVNLTGSQWPINIYTYSQCFFIELNAEPVLATTTNATTTTTPTTKPKSAIARKVDDKKGFVVGAVLLWALALGLTVSEVIFLKKFLKARQKARYSTSGSSTRSEIGPKSNKML